MAIIQKWTTAKIAYDTSIDSTNNTLEVTLNDSPHTIVVPEGHYMSRVTPKESTLIDVIQTKLKEAIPTGVEAVFGVVAGGIDKEIRLVFLVEDSSTLAISGTLTSIVGDIEVFV